MNDVASAIIAMEKGALERWGRGDPSGFLEISAPDVIYFDPYVERRIDGREALAEYYRPIFGQIHIDRFELLNPSVLFLGDAAVLTFNYVSFPGSVQDRWNCTEVYRRSGDRWLIVQTHWSYTQVFKYKMTEKGK